jgi:hypothetical protein
MSVLYIYIGYSRPFQAITGYSARTRILPCGVFKEVDDTLCCTKYCLRPTPTFTESETPKVAVSRKQGNFFQWMNQRP